MRYLAIFALPVALAAQSADGDKVTQALISEIQQLRLAIERSTLLSTRTQLALSQVQIQETAVARLQTQLNDVRSQGAALAGQRARLGDAVQQLEQKRTSPGYAAQKDIVEMQMNQLKLELTQANTTETARSAREGDLTSQLQAVQSQLADSRSRIAEMERALDAALQQMLRPK